MVELNEKAASGRRVFESWIDSQMAYSGQPGLSVAVVHDQDVVWGKGFGYSDRENKIEANRFKMISSDTGLMERKLSLSPIVMVPLLECGLERITQKE